MVERKLVGKYEAPSIKGNLYLQKLSRLLRKILYALDSSIFRVIDRYDKLYRDHEFAGYTEFCYICSLKTKVFEQEKYQAFVFHTL